MMLRIVVLGCLCAVLFGCGSKTATEKPEADKTDSGAAPVAPVVPIAPGVSQSSINPQGARQSADMAKEDLNKAASDLQKNLDRAKGARGD